SEAKDLASAGLLRAVRAIPVNASRARARSFASLRMTAGGLRPLSLLQIAGGDEFEALLDFGHVLGPGERRGHGLAGFPRLADSGEPVLQAGRGEDPEDLHLAGAVVVHDVLDVAADGDEAAGRERIGLPIHDPAAGALIDEQKFVVPLMRVVAHMRAGLQHLDAGREKIDWRIAGVELRRRVAGGGEG